MLEVEGGTGEYSFSGLVQITFKYRRDLIGLGPGLYSVIVSDEVGCSVEINNIEIAEPEELSGIEFVSEYDCGYGVSAIGLGDGFVNLVVGGGNTCSGNEYVYQWTGPNGFSSNEEDINNLYPGTYQVLITDVEGCTF